MAIHFYFVYNIKENLNGENPFMSGQDIAFAAKRKTDLGNHYTMYERGLDNSSLIIYFSLSDPRDTLKTKRAGEFHMFELTSLPSSEAAIESVLMDCVSEEDWPENVLTELENNGFLNAEQKEQANAYRVSSVNVPYDT